MSSTNETIERNCEATIILRTYLSKGEPKLVDASLNELVEVLRARYQVASEINPEGVAKFKKLQLSLSGFSNKILVEKIYQDEIMIGILYEFMRQNISVNEIITAISSINNQPITDNIPSLVKNRAEITEDTAANSLYETVLNAQDMNNTQGIHTNQFHNLNPTFNIPQITGGRRQSTPMEIISNIYELFLPKHNFNAAKKFIN